MTEPAPFVWRDDEPPFDPADIDAAATADLALEDELAFRRTVTDEKRRLRARRAAARELDEEETAGRGKLVDELLSRGDLAQLPKPEPLIEGVLPRHALALLEARNSAGKTFIAVDQAACIATGKAWQGRPVIQGRVLYIAAEGAYGIHARFTAWEIAWSRTIPSEALTVLPRPVNLLRSPAEVAQLVEIITAGGYLFVVVDTLHRSAAGADENTARDMGVVVDALHQLRHATDGGTIYVLHHTDKADNGGRGSSSVEDAADVVYRVQKDEYRIRLWREKNKDGPQNDEHHLQLLPVADSCIVEHHGGFGVPAHQLSERQDQLLGIARDHFAATGFAKAELQKVAEGFGISRSTYYLTFNRLVEAGHVVNTGTDKRPHYGITSSAVQPDDTPSDQQVSSLSSPSPEEVQ